MVSIIMPTYNSEKYIRQAIDSVIEQTFTDWELIIIDDCSTDSTSEIIKSYSDERIIYIQNPHNEGVSNSRNIGIRRATGKWIAFLDSDDMWEKDKLEWQISYANNKNIKWVFTGSSFMDEEGVKSSYIMEVPEVVEYNTLLKQNVISCSSVMILKEIIINYPMQNNPKIHEDFATWLTIMKEQKIFAYGINRPLLVYRVRKNSKSGNKISAAVMTYRVYRNVGIGFFKSIYCWVCYVIKSVLKYKNI